MYIINPIYYQIYLSPRVDKDYILKKDIDKFSLYLSFLLALIFSLSFFLSKYLNNIGLIIISIASLIILCTSILLFRFIKLKTLFLLMYIISLGLFLGVTSRYLNYFISSIIINGENIFYPYKLIVFNISIMIVLSHLVMEILNIIFFIRIKHFTYKFVIFLFFMLLITLGINVTFKINDGLYDFIVNTIASIIIFILYGLFLFTYDAEMKRLIDERLSRDNISSLLILKPSLFVYLLSEIFYCLFKRRK